MTQTLRELLVELGRAPEELIESLRVERESATRDDSALGRDLARSELRFLIGRQQTRVYGADYAAAVHRARRAAHASEFQCLEQGEKSDPTTLFDLVELRASVAHDLDAQHLDAIDREIEDRIERLDTIDDTLREEARERYVALQTEEEDLDLGMRISMLRESERLFDTLGKRFGDRDMRKLGARVRRSRCDRVLAWRLERLLTRRGATLLETTSIVLLFVVFAMLLLPTFVTLSPSAKALLTVADASICLFFIGEFCLKLALAPLRWSWFARNALTDLLPAIPAALYFAMPAPGGGPETTAFRALRLLRIAWIARYIHLLRAPLRLVRLLLFMAKGLDALVARFSTLLNRNFVFFEADSAGTVGARSPDAEVDLRVLAFRAQRREHCLIRDLTIDEGRQKMIERADRLAAVYAELAPTTRRSRGRVASAGGIARDVPVEVAVEELYAVRPEELGSWLAQQDIQAIDRVVRVLNSPLIRSMPLIRSLRLDPEETGSPEERVVAFGKRIAALLERWHERARFVADLQGIVTGPQVLDRLATAMVKASFRPARNLILFGLFFVLVRLLVGQGTMVGLFLSKFVATPVLVLGSVCAVVLAVGSWLKRLAGEAADKFKLTSEAAFLSLLELVKRRSQDEDLQFLAERVFRWDIEAWEGAAWIGNYVRSARTGIAQEASDAPDMLRDEVYRVALLYLHFLDGAVLHQNDVKTNEQLLANLSLENIRGEYLSHGRKERKRLRRLSPQGGPLFGGPYLWFRCITESIAVETAKRVTDYNRNCVTLRQREVATFEQRRTFAVWLRRRHRREEGRLEHIAAPDSKSRFQTTEFNALDFLTVDPIREEHIERVFGPRVLQLLRTDRRGMIREIFGTRPLHRLPRAERTFNAYAFYRMHLSSGRIFLLPLFALRGVWRAAYMSVQKTADIVREILSPHAALKAREAAHAPLSVALRKIHRMKAPILLEAMRMRVEFDPAYCGAPPGWTVGRGFEDETELEHDMDFLDLRERDREELRRGAESMRRRVEELLMIVQEHTEHFMSDDPDLARRGERAVTISYVTDRRAMRTLFRADRWFEDELARMESPDTELPAFWLRSIIGKVGRGFRRHPVDVWLRRHLPDRRVSRRGRRNFKRNYYGDRSVRHTIKTWLALEEGVSPSVIALERAISAYRARDEVSRELAALRAVQSLSVLDVRNYRRLIFEIGDYESDGESRATVEALPHV